MKQRPFLCLMRRRFWAFRSWGNPAVVIIVLIVLIGTPILNLFCYQKFINYAGRTHLIFTNIYVINISDCCEFCQMLCFSQFSQNPRITPLFILRQVFSLTSLKDSHRSAHRLQQGAWMEDSAFPCFLYPPPTPLHQNFPHFYKLRIVFARNVM